MKIGIINEGITHVSLVPTTVKKLCAQGIEVYFEKNCGAMAFIEDKYYEEAGAIMKERAYIIANSDIICTFHPIAEKEIRQFKPGSKYISLFKPFEANSMAEKLTDFPIYLHSLDMIPRTTIAQTMDVLSMIGSIAGYQAVLKAANLVPRYFPMLITSAGNIKPIQVLVIGVGVAGLQAIATAKRLGAKVVAMDTREAAGEEAKSLGASFIQFENAKDDHSMGGYAVEQTENFLKNQRATIAELLPTSDVVITTAQVRGSKAPLLIMKEGVNLMRKGSVIMDLASFSGGNCELTKDQEILNHTGVWIYGNSDLALEMPYDNSTLFSNNLYNYLSLFIKDGELKVDLNHEILKHTCIHQPQS